MEKAATYHGYTDALGISIIYMWFYWPDVIIDCEMQSTFMIYFLCLVSMFLVEMYKGIIGRIIKETSNYWCCYGHQITSDLPDFEDTDRLVLVISSLNYVASIKETVKWTNDLNIAKRNHRACCKNWKCDLIMQNEHTDTIIMFCKVFWYKNHDLWFCYPQ